MEEIKLVKAMVCLSLLVKILHNIPRLVTSSCKICNSATEQASSIKLSPEEDVSRKIYTPSIKYTKLGFKVN